MKEQDYSLVRVETEDQWQAYHTIRSHVLFEDHGHFDVYDRNHPDDREENNHPVLLLFRNEPIGAMRVDLVPEMGYAIMRTVAIRQEYQRCGHGRVMMGMAEDHAFAHGAAFAVTISAIDAVSFYSKCGYELYDWDPTELCDDGKQMRRLLASDSAISSVSND